MSERDTTSVRQAVRAALSRCDRVVLGVSGGLDSMTLLDAAVATMPRDRLIVATFDHATGPAATSACELVRGSARAHGVECVMERAEWTPAGEAALRDARWAFLRRVAAERGASVATAHTQDDQVETVLMRVLRDAGARGLAALFADSPVLRPLVRVTRRQLVSYARRQALVWLEDPSNATPMYLRNRVRGDLLPALRHVRPTVDADLLAVARKAARWRADVAALVDDMGLRASNGGIDVPAELFADAPADTATVCWPEIAARVGVTLDRRGVLRLVDFASSARVGARVQVAGGWEVHRSRGAFQLRRMTEAAADAPDAANSSDAEALPNSGEATHWKAWSFRRSADSTEVNGSPWSAWLPDDLPLSVRGWRAGDAMVVRAGGRPRKVKRLLTDAGVTGHDRAGWPVVLAGEQIVWIPGVRRIDAETARPGRPGLPFVCEYNHR